MKIGTRVKLKRRAIRELLLTWTEACCVPSSGLPSEEVQAFTDSSVEELQTLLEYYISKDDLVGKVTDNAGKYLKVKFKARVTEQYFAPKYLKKL